MASTSIMRFTECGYLIKSEHSDYSEQGVFYCGGAACRVVDKYRRCSDYFVAAGFEILNVLKIMYENCYIMRENETKRFISQY